MRIVSLSFLFFLLLSCGQKITEEQKTVSTPQLVFEAGKTYKVSCNTNAGNTYSLYLPSSYDTAKTFPIVYFFDPHGKGNFPVEKYKTIADELNCILAGTDNTQNGMDRNTVSANATLFMNDCRKKLKTDNRKMFTCGFSGGGRIASNLAVQNPEIAGVISCSAGLSAPVSQIRKELVFVGIAGKEDMNLSEVFDSGEALKNSGIKHDIMYFDGPHEWPPAESIHEAIEFCLNPTLSKSDNSGVSKSTIEKEKQLKSFYTEAFQKNDLTWWKKEFKNLEKKIDVAKGEDRNMNIRLKNFISLLAYSFSNSALKLYSYSGDIDYEYNFSDTPKFIDIYELVDPENSEHAYLRAKYYALKNDDANAGTALNEAAGLGFNDKERLQHEQLFIPLQNTEGYKKIMQEE